MLPLTASSPFLKFGSFGAPNLHAQAPVLTLSVPGNPFGLSSSQARCQLTPALELDRVHIAVLVPACTESSMNVVDGNIKPVDSDVIEGSLI